MLIIVKKTKIDVAFKLNKNDFCNNYENSIEQSTWNFNNFYTKLYFIIIYFQIKKKSINYIYKFLYLCSSIL